MRKSSSSLQKLLKRAENQVIGAVTHVETKQPVVALTFDDGPHPDFTPQMLEILKTYRAQATFFMVGAAAERCPDVVRSVAEDGHTIGNHSWNHIAFPALTSWEREHQLANCQETLLPYASQLFRPPYGSQCAAANLDVRKQQFRIVAWNLDVEDWVDGDSRRMARRLIGGIRPGSIVLLHDAIFRTDDSDDLQLDRRHLLEAVEIVLDTLSNRFRFVDVPTLLDAGTPVMGLW